MSYKEIAEKLGAVNQGIFLSPILPLEVDMDINGRMFASYCYPPSLSGLQPAEYSGYRVEEFSWHDTCYLHTALTPTPTVKIWGPDTTKFCEKYIANTFKNFPVGKGKHAIMCDEKGRIMVDGVLLKTGEDEYVSYWLDPWLGYCIMESGMDVSYEDITEQRFLFQLGGPKSLEILEAAAGENYHDIKFMYHRMGKVAGREVRILRMGMAGSLAYEVHGQIEDSHAVLQQILKAGKKYGLQRLGITAYNMTHWECGFPQSFLDFPTPWAENEGFKAFLNKIGVGVVFDTWPRTGSMGTDMSLRYRNPIELGWEKTINFDHVFLGKEALEKIAVGPHRKMVTLEWNREDILDIHASQLDLSVEPYADISTPDDISHGIYQFHADQVLNRDGQCIGISTGRMVAWFYRSMISICSLDSKYANIGEDVYVLWGAPGTRQKKIRASVTRWPYFDTGRNQNVDVSTIPVGTMD
jgi:glycine cleavage system aminomethyltransferase T